MMMLSDNDSWFGWDVVVEHIWLCCCAAWQYPCCHTASLGLNGVVLLMLNMTRTMTRTMTMLQNQCRSWSHVLYSNVESDSWCCSRNVQLLLQLQVWCCWTWSESGPWLTMTMLRVWFAGKGAQLIYVVVVAVAGLVLLCSDYIRVHIWPWLGLLQYWAVQFTLYSAVE